MTTEVLSLGPRIHVIPVIHGSGDFAVEVRRVMLERKFDCLAVPLPQSFQAEVEVAIEHLPGITVVTQAEPGEFPDREWHPERESETESALPVVSYVPVDPCQPVIAALRIALQEQIPRVFIDRETAVFEARSAGLPDPRPTRHTALLRAGTW